METKKGFIARRINVCLIFMAGVAIVFSIVVIGLIFAELDRTIALITLAALILVEVLLLFAFLGRTHSYLYAPIKELTKAVDALTEGDVSIDLPADASGEFNNLMNSIIKLSDNIRDQAHVAERISGGDLTVNVPIRSKHDLLGKKLYALIKKNNELLRNINSCSEQVSSGSKSIAESSQYLAQGAAEQSASIEEISVTVDEIAIRTKNNADKAVDVSNLADKAKAEAVDGNEMVLKMLESMESIRESSENISKITGVIESIAFQTNILALNAAIEAARAGAHGKGFAVVADEVKNLASKSAVATQEITEIIQESAARVNEGMSVASTAAEDLKKITEAVELVSEHIDEITGATSEQAEGLNQVRAAISQVSTVVQSNTATSEQAAAASQELAGQATLLMDMVDKYELEDASLGKKQEHVYVTK